MVNFYRVRLKQKGLEVEVESHDKEFVKKMLSVYVPRMGIQNVFIEPKVKGMSKAIGELHKDPKQKGQEKS